MVDGAVNRALINQAGVLSNTVFNAVARTFKEGQVPPSCVGPAHQQPGSPVVIAPSASTAVAGVEATSSPCTLGMTNAQSTPITCYRSIGISHVRICPSQLVGLWYAPRIDGKKSGDISSG